MIIGYENNGIYGSVVIEYLLRKIHGPVAIRWVINKHCNFIVQSNTGHLWNKRPKKYIYWSGESYEPSKNKHAISSINISTTTLYPDMIYTPYVLYSPYLYKERLHTGVKDRKYFIAYCSSNKVNEREEFFAKCVDIIGPQVCHSFGYCDGNRPMSKKPKISGKWYSDSLIQTYTQYKFVIAFENGVVDGYVTEKILNAFYSGAIPVYHGSKNINELFNPKAFINVSNFKTYDDCIHYMLNMKENELEEMATTTIYQDTDIIQLLNDNRPNPLRDQYIEKIKQFLA
jgi:hypothetical protein